MGVPKSTKVKLVVKNNFAGHILRTAGDALIVGPILNCVWGRGVGGGPSLVLQASLCPRRKKNILPLNEEERMDFIFS